ncbi:unnamed protein product [Adineta steineri]|uniref:Uncharacterized protein n=1 Tax=Adineta steineri TaxID=433720 RepID=A0A813T8H3_9BILA|nr:unnamed protein product [Adineta steineri]CAF4217667.1 unnamed protein product [Adineta steineri]
MFEYIFIFIIIIGSILYINRPQREKQFKSSKTGKKVFGKSSSVTFEAPRPIPYPDWSVETTHNQWNKYHTEKLERLSSERASRLCKILSKAEDAALETMELLSKYLIDRYPSLFEYQQNKEQIQIKTTGEIYPIKSSNPLKYAS